MDKKIAIPAGLAVLVVMAVVGMLSIFNMTSVQTVEASLENLNTGETLNIGSTAYTDKVTNVTLSASPTLVGDNARLVITFLTTGAAINSGGAAGDLAPGSGEIKIRFDSSKFKLPATVSASSVTISASTLAYVSTLNDSPNMVNNVQSATVSYAGAEMDLPVLTLVVPDMDDSANTGANGIGSGGTVTITILQSAGITLPVKAGGYDISVWNSNDSDVEAYAEYQGDEITLYRDISLSAISGGRGDTVTATASGYASGTATFWRDADGDGVRDAAETDLCSGSVSSSTATCDFDISNPPFSLGEGDDVTPSAYTNATALAGFGTAANLVNAIDGEGKVAQWSSAADLAKAVLELEGGISIVPSTANPGDTVTIQITDGAVGAVASCNIVGANASCSGTVPSSGSLDVTATIPDGVPSGTQKFYIILNGAVTLKADITIGSASVTSTPTTGAVPNQRITMSGSGFTASSTVATVYIGGELIHATKVNDGSTITIDNGGSWSASIDLPITPVTESSGSKEIKVTDGGGRVGKMDLDMASKTLVVTPEEGRVGSNVTVKGTGFPGKNNDGNSNSVTVTYTSGASENSSSVTPDSSGNFTTTVQVPSGAAIPSTNTVKATYDLYTAETASTKSGTTNITSGNHSVPSATVTTDISAGGAGSSVTASGVGFKRFTTITTIKVGDIDVTPSPKPTTDTNGTVEVTFIVPGTDTGVQTIALAIGGTTASMGFTVTDAIVSDVLTPVADALEPLLTAGTLASAFYYDNLSKDFQFHIVDDAFVDANNLIDVQGGEPLWIEVTADTTVELAGTSFDLTCVNADCFNLVVFP